MYYLLDGTYTGFLSGVFESFERKEWDVYPVLKEASTGDFFQESREIISDSEKSRRVYDGLKKKLGASKAMDFFRVYLSEDMKAWCASYRIIRQIFTTGENVLQNYGNPDVLYFAQTLKKVSRERHRMKAFIRFQKSSDGLFFAVVEPDFNVLPLITDFFRNRYADQRWLIYDVKRKYGLMYDIQSITEVYLTPEEKDMLSVRTEAISLDERDESFQRLWQQYYKSTNIESRKNMKLHLQYVPKRYWKYLPEKYDVKK